MPDTAPICDIRRGDFHESQHYGRVAIVHADQGLIAALGNAENVILPRSSCKMIQALPLIESGAADAVGLNGEHLALACASHTGANGHTSRVATWLSDIGLDDDALRCGPQVPEDADAYKLHLCSGHSLTQTHNNCSGKHAGFLTLAQHLKAGPDYIHPTHPVQLAVHAAFEDVTGQQSQGHAIDGCSAPNYATTLTGLATAMARFAAASDTGDTRQRAMHRLTQAMMTHPDLVAGRGRACTALMDAMNGRAAIKTGAEGVYIAIVPERRIGVAVKAACGTTRASECAITAVLVALGVLNGEDPAARTYLNASILNRRGIETGAVRAAPDLLGMLNQL